MGRRRHRLLPALAQRPLCLFLITTLTAPPASALTAREILDRAKALEDGERQWRDRTQILNLQSYDAGGNQRQRRIQVFSRRPAVDEEKNLSFLLAPPEVKGTAFLQWSQRGRDDEQWLYLPEFRRTRQISMRLKDESFVGTDFTYRDLEIIGKILRWTDAEAPSTLTGQESVGDRPCYAIELRPQQEGTPYKQIRLALEQDRLVVRKLTFIDADGIEIKTMTADDLRTVGAVPIAHQVEMRNLKRGSRTLVTVEKVELNTDLADDLFTQRSLEHGPP